MLPTRADCLARDVFSHYSVTRESTEAVEDLNWLDDLMRTHEVASCVLEVFYDGGWIDYRFMLVSSAFERMTGLRGAVGRSMRRLRPTHEQFWYELFWRVVQTGEVASFDHAACALNKWFRGHAFRAGSPGAYRVVVIFEVFARSAADDGARSVAQESDAMLERFGATLAHELRGPLAPLRSGLSLVQKLAGESADLRGTLAMMNRQFSRLSCLVDDLLDVGRLGSANVRIQRLRLNLHHVVSESIEACGEEIAACRHHVSVEAGDEDVLTRGDPRRLAQVFTNLLMNAAKYTPAGGRIVARIANRNGAATVEIEDNGSGISAEDLPHIFDLFNQGQDHRYQPKGGLGIGLSIVRTIVRLHGGEVSAHSPGPGRGSTFAVRLPACG